MIGLQQVKGAQTYPQFKEQTTSTVTYFGNLKVVKVQLQQDNSKEIKNKCQSDDVFSLDINKKKFQENRQTDSSIVQINSDKARGDQGIEIQTKQNKNSEICQNQMSNDQEDLIVSSSLKQLKILNKQQYPVPQGNSAYCLGKKAEQIEKDLKKAEFYYRLAIKQKDRLTSAVKDLAGVLQALAKSQEAISLLKKYENIFYDKKKFFNLLQNLENQFNQKGNAVFKLMRVSNMTVKQANKEFVQSLFPDVKRIQNIDIFKENLYAIIQFYSHSAGRKALSSYNGYQYLNLQLEWLNLEMQSGGPVILSQKRLNQFQQQKSKEIQDHLFYFQQIDLKKQYTYNQQKRIHQSFNFSIFTNFIALDQRYTSFEDQSQNFMLENSFQANKVENSSSDQCHLNFLKIYDLLECQ